ncbi:MAG: hypothetical protein E7160_01510 [Firmicutes bacterium]|nr:hypothetical protein [Bacillota bacterium]
MSTRDNVMLIYRMIIVIVSGIGLYLNFKLETVRIGILYFTNISNLLCFLYFLGVVVATITHKLKKNDFYYLSKGMVTMSVTLTYFVYNLVLNNSGTVSIFDNHELETNIVHIVVPLLVIFDYVIFGTKGHLKKNYPYIWSSILIIYQLFITVYSSLGGRFLNGDKYPYFYMDVSKYGVRNVLISGLIILVFYIGYGSIIQTLDNKLAEVKEKRK